MNVGDILTTREQIAALPDGTVIGYTGNDWTYTKQGPNAWVDHVHSRIVPDTNFSLGMNRIVSLPTGGGSPIGSPIDLDAVPVGENIYVGTSRSVATWTRTEAGLRNSSGNVVLPTSFFAGAVTEGLVGTTPSFRQPVAGEVRTDGGYCNVVVTVGAVVDQPTLYHVWYALFHADGGFVGMRERSFREDEDPSARLGQPVPTTPEWYVNAWSLLSVMAQERAARIAAEQAPRVETEGPTPAAVEEVRRRAHAEGVVQGRREFRTEVSEAFQNAWDGASWTFGEVNEVLDGLGCEMVSSREEVNVTVEVEGTYEVELEAEELEQYVNEHRAADVQESVTVTIPFTYSYYVERTVSEGDCACGDISQSDVEANLRDNDIRFDRISFTEECQNC